MGVNQFSDLTWEEFDQLYVRSETTTQTLAADHPLMRRRHHKQDRWVDTHDDVEHNGYSVNDYEYLDSLKRCRSHDLRDLDMVTRVKD